MFPMLGYEVHVKKILEDHWRDLFVPESHIHNPIKFKEWLTKCHLRPRWKVSLNFKNDLISMHFQLECPPKAWRNMVEKCLGNTSL